jgi:hypothetical protein
MFIRILYKTVYGYTSCCFKKEYIQADARDPRGGIG